MLGILHWDLKHINFDLLPHCLKYVDITYFGLFGSPAQELHRDLFGLTGDFRVVRAEIDTPCLDPDSM